MPPRKVGEKSFVCRLIRRQPRDRSLQSWSYFLFAKGLGPTFAGLYQINIIVPAGVPVGDSVIMVLSMPNGLSHQLPIAIRP